MASTIQRSIQPQWVHQMPGSWWGIGWTHLCWGGICWRAKERRWVSRCMAEIPEYGMKVNTRDLVQDAIRKLAGRAPVIFYAGNLLAGAPPPAGLGITNDREELLELVVDGAEGR